MSDGRAEFDKALSLLGKMVTVTLDTATIPHVISHGRLLRISDYGEVVVQQDDGACHYCWPMLLIEEVAEEWEVEP